MVLWPLTRITSCHVAFLGCIAVCSRVVVVGLAFTVPHCEDNKASDQKDAGSCGADGGSCRGSGAEGASRKRVEGGRHVCGVD